jgi:hypothetical protein
MLADVVDGNDVGMLQAGGCRGLGLKALHHVSTTEVAKRQQLECDDPVQIELPSFIDHSHAALPDFFQEFVPPEPLPSDLRTLTSELWTLSAAPTFAL